MTVWMVIHEVDYEGFALHEIFSTKEAAKEFADGYLNCIYPNWEGTWDDVVEEYTWHDHTIRICPYHVDSKVGHWHWE
ncbi:MAG: DUF7336 domain-containing protein [Candidatus Thorarchaeota archaeon]|jgi:hypothetical protein